MSRVTAITLATLFAVIVFSAAVAEENIRDNDREHGEKEVVASGAEEWDFSKHSIPTEEILSGGPPRDGIPALTDPKYVKAREADFMREDEDVIGVFVRGVARAYPLRVLSWHELVNDRFGELPVLVSW